MERREPTLTGGASNDREESANRRSPAAYDDVRTSRTPAYAAAPSSSPLPAIALSIGLIGVLGAGFLGFQLMEAQAILAKNSARIAQLESQLNLTSTESVQSVHRRH